MSYKNNCLAFPFDNIYFPTEKFKILRKGIIPFFDAFDDFSKARKISDHIPIWVQLKKLYML